MSNHLHAIVQAKEDMRLTDILRDFKKFTSKQIVALAEDEPESRREWMLTEFRNACRHLARPQEYKVWQEGNHAEIIFSNSFLTQKLDYVHQNPVKDILVEHP